MNKNIAKSCFIFLIAFLCLMVFRKIQIISENASSVKRTDEVNQPSQVVEFNQASQTGQSNQPSNTAGSNQPAQTVNQPLNTAGFNQPAQTVNQPLNTAGFNQPAETVGPNQPSQTVESNHHPITYIKDRILPSKEEIDKLSHNELTHLYHSVIQSLHIFCPKLMRFGITKGAYYLCDDVNFRPKKNCLMFSFGIDYDFSFDTEVVNRYGCQVHAFDPRMKGISKEPHKNVFFYKTALGDKNMKGAMNFKTFSTIRNELGISEDRIIDILKIDIEEGEWKAVPEMIQKGVFKNVRQLIFESHTADLRYRKPWQQNTKERYLTALHSFRHFYELGFRNYYFFNPMMETKYFTYKYQNVNRQESSVTIVSMINTSLM